MFSTITYIKISQSGSPGLVVKGGDSLSKGCEFKSRHGILDKNFSLTYLLQNL